MVITTVLRFSMDHCFFVFKCKLLGSLLGSLLSSIEVRQLLFPAYIMFISDNCRLHVGQVVIRDKLVIT